MNELEIMFICMLVFIGSDFMLILYCINKINVQLYFKYFNRETWMFIIIIGSVFGQISYLLLENNGASR